MAYNAYADLDNLKLQADYFGNGNRLNSDIMSYGSDNRQSKNVLLASYWNSFIFMILHQLTDRT
jgi:hypothetical protein